MHILLTHAYYLSDDPVEQAVMKPYVPLGILYLSAWMEQAGIEHDVFDSTFESPENQWQEIVRQRPDIIGIYVNLMTRKNVLRLMNRIRATTETKHIKIILGGPEVRNHAEQFLNYGSDFLVLGEGEVSFLALVESIRDNTPQELVQGIVFKNSLGEIIFTSEREKIKSLDLLPEPNRKKVNLQLYLDAWKKRHGKNAISISTMRGCPYTCKWCSRAVYGLSYRRRSPEKVVEEIQHIYAQYQPDTLWFVDDVFTISHKWLEEFSQLVQKLPIRIQFECITRADRMNEHVVSLLKKCGCFRVWIGAESGSQRIIDAMDRRVDVQAVRDMIRLTQRYGMEAGTFIMLGYPGETESDILETAAHLKTAIPNHFTITTAYPIKGTELYTEITSAITNMPEWSKGSDREIKFKRTYPEKYYPYAVRYVANEVAYARKGNPINKIKSASARTAMWLIRTFA